MVWAKYPIFPYLDPLACRRCPLDRSGMNVDSSKYLGAKRGPEAGCQSFTKRISRMTPVVLEVHCGCNIGSRQVVGLVQSRFKVRSVVGMYQVCTESWQKVGHELVSA